MRTTRRRRTDAILQLPATVHHCGIDLHVKTMYVCILDAADQVLVHRNVKSTPEAFLEIVAPHHDDLVVAADCMFTWYWLGMSALPRASRSCLAMRSR